MSSIWKEGENNQGLCVDDLMPVGQWLNTLGSPRVEVQRHAIGPHDQETCAVLLDKGDGLKCLSSAVDP